MRLISLAVNNLGSQLKKTSWEINSSEGVVKTIKNIADKTKSNKTVG